MKTTSTPVAIVALAAAAVSLLATGAAAHPGSGIVVDGEGQVYFVDTGVNSQLGLWKINRAGRLGRQTGPHYHFLTIDRRGQIATARLPAGVEAVGRRPTLVVSGDFPAAVGADGALYYPQPQGEDRVRIMRAAPGKEPTEFARLPAAMETGADGRSRSVPWIHGLAGAADGSLYYSERHAVRKIAPSGEVSLVAGDVKVPDCSPPKGAGDERLAPGLRGLDVQADGTVLVAASACSAVLSIAPGQAPRVVLRAEESWSPTGVAVFGDDVYVLEYLHTDTQRREDWLPRVPKLSRDGSVTTIATVTQELRRTTERPAPGSR